MSKRLRSYVAAIMAMLFAFAIVAVPQKAWAAEVYSDSDSGISVSTRDPGNLEPTRDVTISVVVESTVVAEPTSFEVPFASQQLKVTVPEGFSVQVQGENGVSPSPGVNGNWNLAFGIKDNHSITVSITEFKTRDDIDIWKGETFYGTFSWMKSTATSSSFLRNATIVVDGTEVFTTQVATPKNLSNALLGGENPEFWFTPNQELYSLSGVEITPDTLSQVTNKNLTISLKSRCQCGQPGCMCEGGGCDCTPGSCTCENCVPTSGDTRIVTDYGVIDFQKPFDPGLPGSDGYNLTVKLFVNGQLVKTTEQLRLKTGENDCLNFTPRQGYYYHSRNGYDINSTGASWVADSGYLYIQPADRDAANELSIYLWTFNSHTNLDIDRRPWNAAQDLEGYLISYEAYNPATGKNETYTYEATSFMLAQSQIVPLGTPITITGICPKGKEVTKWSHGYYAEGITLTSPEDEDASDTVAPGNTVTLEVENNSLTSITIYAEGVDWAKAPTQDEVVDLVGVNGVTVDCVNTNVEHKDKTYELVADSLTVDSPTEGNTKVEVVVNPTKYVDKYNIDVESGHALSSDSQSVSISLEHDGTGWKVVEDETPVTVKVDCGAEPEPEEPDVPTENELSDLLKGKVTVTCTNAEAAHEPKNYGLLKDSYKRPTPDAVKFDTYSITLNADKYVDQFGVDKGLVHLLAEGQSSEIPVSFVYDSAANEWKLADVSSTISIDVTCVSAPDFDDINKAYPNGLVEVECTNVKSGHEPKTYGAMDGGTFLNGTLSYGNGTYNYTFEVAPAAYVQKYSFDCDRVFHYGQLKSKTVEMTYDFSKNAWTVADSTPIKFEVECDLTSGEDVPTLTEDTIKALLCDSVTIDCVNSDADHDPRSETYGVADVEGGYKLLGIGSNGTNYTATIEIYAGQFITKFESESGVLHGLAEDESRTKTVTLVHDGIDWIADDAKVTFKVVCNDKPVQTAGTITVTPVDMTIYEGGSNGYDGVVGESETGSTTLPEPLFEVTLPVGVSAEDVTFANGGNSWTLESAAVASGTRAADNLYRFVAEDGSEPVRVAYTDDGELMQDDGFDVNTVGDTFNTLDISIVSNGGTPLATTDDGTAYAIATGTGDLTVRAVNDGNDAVSDIVENAPTSIPDGEAVAVVPEGQDTVYTLNDTGATLPDGEQPSLLFDSIIDDDDHPRTEALNDEIEKRDDIDEGFKSEIKYLDLVDANNGNAWITSSAGIDIYWDYPGKTNQNTKFKVLHFEGLHRDNSGSNDSGFEMGDIEGATITEVKDVKLTDTGIKFHVEPGNFSPYALVWDYEDNGGTTPGGGGGTTTKYYKIEASAGEGGSISPSGTVKVAAGSDKTFTITPAEGYTIGNVVIDGKDYRQVASYTFNDVNEDHTISVTFMRGNDPANPDDTGVSDWLETDDHIVFLHGYGDGSGTFGPENQMTRAEVAQMFYNLLLDKSRGDKPVNFTDVPADAYYAEPVFTLASLGIVNGTSPETFEPNRPITRAEFVAIAMRFTNGDYEGENLFVDVPEDAWYRDYVVGAVGYGWIYGYQDGSQKFGPLDTITRGQATMVTNRMLWRACDTVWAMEHMDQLKTFVDLGQSHYAFFDVVEATNAHDYTRVGDTRYENWTGLVK